MDINRCFEPKRALKQVTTGHEWVAFAWIAYIGILHKPQNILISAAKGGNGTSSGSSPSSSGTTGNAYRMLISDFWTL